LEDAIKAFNKAISLKHDYTEAYNNLGVAFKVQGKLEEAVEAFHKALALNPNFVGAYNNLGNVLKEQGKLDEALEAFNKAFVLRPDYEPTRAAKLHQQAHICDWGGLKSTRHHRRSYTAF
jgi:tetratricopeptide (TPR) repeat protein